MVILTKNRFITTICIGLVIFSACAIVLWYPSGSYELFQNWLNKSLNSNNYTYRGIGTNKDLWLNGYLGIFFRFKYFGYLNWLFIPLSIYFLVNITKREKWEIALWSVVIALGIFLCIKGYANYRYQFTLFPMLLSLILLFGWDIVKKRSVIIKKIVFIICAATILMSFYALRNNYFGHLKAFIFNKQFTHPQKIVEYINHKADLGNDGVILEYNQPFLYYYTDKKSLSWYEKKVRSFMYKYDKEKESSFGALEKNFRVLKDEFKIKYILSNTTMEKLISGSYIRGFYKNITEYNSDYVCEDNGYKLFKLRDSPYNLSLDVFSDRKAIFETDFSDWKWPDEMSIDDIAKTGGPVKIGGFRGDFIFKRISAKDGNILRVMLKRPWANKVPKVQFGFCDKSILNVNGGDIVSVIANVRLSASNKKGASLFVQDKTNDWVREKIYFGGNLWKDRLIYRKIREGNSNFGMGIYWEPESTEDWLDINSVRIFVRK